MKFNFTEFLITFIVVVIAGGFGYWQGKVQYKAEAELKETQQKLEETVGKLVDSLDETVKELKPKWEVTEGKEEWKITDGEEEWVYPKYIEFEYSDSNKPVKKPIQVFIDLSDFPAEEIKTINAAAKRNKSDCP